MRTSDLQQAIFRPSLLDHYPLRPQHWPAVCCRAIRRRTWWRRSACQTSLRALARSVGVQLALGETIACLLLTSCVDMAHKAFYERMHENAPALLMSAGGCCFTLMDTFAKLLVDKKGIPSVSQPDYLPVQNAHSRPTSTGICRLLANAHHCHSTTSLSSMERGGRSRVGP